MPHLPQVDCFTLIIVYRHHSIYIFLFLSLTQFPPNRCGYEWTHSHCSLHYWCVIVLFNLSYFACHCRVLFVFVASFWMSHCRVCSVGRVILFKLHHTGDIHWHAHATLSPVANVSIRLSVCVCCSLSLPRSPHVLSCVVFVSFSLAHRPSLHRAHRHTN